MTILKPCSSTHFKPGLYVCMVCTFVRLYDGLVCRRVRRERTGVNVIHLEGGEKVDIYLCYT